MIIMSEIKIYITHNDPWCKELKTWLKRKKYSFELFDLDDSDTARDELIEKSNQVAIPMIDVDGEIVVGFHPDKIEELVKKSEE
jgi:glutaredoxin 3